MKYAADEFCKANETLLLAANADATTAGTGVDCRGYDECLVVFNAILCAANAEANVKMQDSSDDSTYADITSAAFTEVTPTNDATTYIARIDLRKRSRYLRAHLTTDGANAVTLSVTLILINSKYGPASQTHTVAFDV